jgi:hypothetical protein
LHRVPSKRSTPFANSMTRGGDSMLTELLAFLDELLSYLESVRDVRGEEGSPARRSPEIERLSQKTRALRDAVSAERQKH